MPWNEVSKMSLKEEFVGLYKQGGITMTELCRRYEISRKTGYALKSRYEAQGAEGLLERSRERKYHPNRTEQEVEEKIVALRERKRSWGSRKIRAYLLNTGERDVPATSTITQILHRHGCIEKQESEKRARYLRFEHAKPNDLWQVDFKGHFAMHQGRCYPLTVLDDHSRFSVGLRACKGEYGAVVKGHFIELFQQYGLPFRMNFDNGNPWATRHSALRYTSLTVWLLRLGIRVSYSRPFHPQTNGKDERFHRTLKEELLRYRTFYDVVDAQAQFDEWRDSYNLERPHEALGLKPPITRYRMSERSYEQALPPVEYGPDKEVRKVNDKGRVNYKGQSIFISESFRGMPVGIQETGEEDEYNVYFCQQKIRCIHLGNK